MSDFRAFDGTKFNTEEEVRRFERKALREIMKMYGKCPWLSTCKGGFIRGCNGSKEEVEACFDVAFDV